MKKISEGKRGLRNRRLYGQPIGTPDDGGYIAAQSLKRRFPPPWRTEQIPGGYVVRDANDQAIAYVYSRSDESEARQALSSSRS